MQFVLKVFQRFPLERLRRTPKGYQIKVVSIDQVVYVMLPCFRMRELVGHAYQQRVLYFVVFYKSFYYRVGIFPTAYRNDTIILFVGSVILDVLRQPFLALGKYSIGNHLLFRLVVHASATHTVDL
jgi:hypothetical protein